MSTKELVIKPLDIDLIAPNASNYMNPDQGGSKIVVIGKPGCFSPGTKILMYDRSVRDIETIKVGEWIMGDDGTPRTVLSLFHDKDDMFEICRRHDDPCMHCDCPTSLCKLSASSFYRREGVVYKDDDKIGRRSSVLYTVNTKHDLVLTKVGDEESGLLRLMYMSVDMYLALPYIEKRKYRLLERKSSTHLSLLSTWCVERQEGMTMRSEDVIHVPFFVRHVGYRDF